MAYDPNSKGYVVTAPMHMNFIVDDAGSISGINSEHGGTTALSTVNLLTSAQILSPTPEILSSTSSIYQLNVYPYTQYRSDGNRLIPQLSTELDLSGNVIAINAGSTTVIGTAFTFNTFTTSSAGVLLQTTLAMPAGIVARGGYIYVDGSGGGGGGSGGSTDTGGGGGGGARGCCQLPVFVPPGNSNIYLQIGAGGAGSAGNAAGNSLAGTSGTESYIKIGSQSGSYLLRLNNGVGGGVATAAGTGGAGGVAANFALSGGAGGGANVNGGAGKPNSSDVFGAQIITPTCIYTGGSGGAGAGNGTSTLGGNGGVVVSQSGNGGAGSGAGGGGASGPWGRQGNVPVFVAGGTGGTGGAGGGSPSAGVSGFADSFGGGGGGGGKTQNGGSGGDGFLRIAI